MMHSLVTSIFLYACELWTLTAELQRRIQTVGNEKLLHDTTHLVQRPYYQRGSPCQDPASNRTTRRPPDHCKQTRTEVVWTCLSFVRSGQIHFCKTEGKEEENKAEREEEVGRRHQEMNMPGVRQVPEDSGEQKKKMG